MARSILLACCCALCLQHGASDPGNDSNQSGAAGDVGGNSSWAIGQPVRLDGSYLNPGGSVRCPSRCRRYFAGAGPRDGAICQKQASGVGTAEQNFELGVACYPAYGCGRDMVTCVDQAFEGSLPDTSDAAAACADLELVNPEDPWTCGTAEENRPPCVNNTPNNNAGKWLKATGHLACGWGSTYGRVYPGYSGPSTPATEYFTVSSDFECCLKAMSFENSSWEEGGAALFFQRVDTQCRVDREKIIYGNMDGSAGRSVKYQDTRCGWGQQFYYRHAAGAADAANLHTGGRCVVDGGFTRLSELSSGTNLPGGEIHDGHELPSHECPGPNEWPFSRNCNVTIKFNTIADAEECCQMCRSMSWLPSKGGIVETDDNDTLVNPCVAWQIVHGRCRILRQEYFDYWNPGMTIHASLTRDSYEPPGNTGWVVPRRGCGSSEEFCNYFSFIYYRQFREAAGVPVDLSLFKANTSDSGKDASYRKVVAQSLPANVDNISFQFNVSSLPSRHDRRPQLMDANRNRSFANLTEESFDSLVDDLNANLEQVTGETAGSGADCGRIQVYAASALRQSSGYEIFDEDSSPEPICASECVSSGEAAFFLCSLRNSTANDAGSGRQLAEVSDRIAISFTAVGTGYDTVDFGVEAFLNEAPTTTRTTTSHTATSSTATTATQTTSAVTQVTTTSSTLPTLTETTSGTTEGEQAANLSTANLTTSTPGRDGSMMSSAPSLLMHWNPEVRLVVFASLSLCILQS